MPNKLNMLQTDSAQKFLFEDHDVRGVIVHLTDSYKTILKQHNYPPAVQKFLGELLLASALLAETIKLSGRMTIQFRSEGAIQLLVAQINDEGHLRALAQWQPDATNDELEKGLGQGELVLTIFHQHHAKPLQSIVSLQHHTISDALAFYFLQSEQLPTLFSFGVTTEYAVGMLLQMMPKAGHSDRDDFWRSLVARVKAMNPSEIFYDNNASFLSFHFPDAAVRLFDARELVFQCGCTVEKMANAIYVMGSCEANLILKEKGEIVVTCEYCNHHYGFDREAVEGIFAKD